MLEKNKRPVQLNGIAWYASQCIKAMAYLFPGTCLCWPWLSYSLPNKSIYYWQDITIQHLSILLQHTRTTLLSTTAFWSTSVLNKCCCDTWHGKALLSIDIFPVATWCRYGVKFCTHTFSAWYDWLVIGINIYIQFTFICIFISYIRLLSHGKKLL